MYIYIYIHIYGISASEQNNMSHHKGLGRLIRRVVIHKIISLSLVAIICHFLLHVYIYESIIYYTSIIYLLLN